MKSLTNNNIIICGQNSKAFDCVHFINALILITVDITFIKLFLQIPCISMDFLQTDYAGVIGSDVPWLECPACNALTWVITVTE